MRDVTQAWTRATLHEWYEYECVCVYSVHQQQWTHKTNSDSTAPEPHQKKGASWPHAWSKSSAKNPSKTDGKDGIPSRGVARALKTSTAACSSMWNLLSERSASTCKHDSEMIHTNYVGVRTTLRQQSVAMCQPTHVPRLRVNQKEDPVLMMAHSKFSRMLGLNSLQGASGRFNLTKA